MKKLIIHNETKVTVTRNPIGWKNLLFRATTNRYGQKGRFCKNNGYFSVSRGVDGRFISRAVS